MRNLCGGLFGVWLATIGADQVTSVERFMFGNYNLYEGLNFIPVMIGLFAMSELLVQSNRLNRVVETVKMKAVQLPSMLDYKKIWKTVLRSCGIGTFIGVLPAEGATVASMIGYSEAQRWSKTPEEFGKGSVEGVAGAEAANNAATGGAMVPTLVLGIPGGATAAIMLVVMQFHGVSFGPSLFENQPKVGYGMFMAMAVSYVFMFLTILPLSRYMSHVTTIPTIYLAPMIISFTLVGGVVPREYMFDMYLALAFGVLGYIARRTGYHVAAILIGVILGPLLEKYFLWSLKKSDGDIMVLFSSTLGNILWVAFALSIILPMVFSMRRKRKLEVPAE